MASTPIHRLPKLIDILIQTLAQGRLPIKQDRDQLIAAPKALSLHPKLHEKFHTGYPKNSHHILQPPHSTKKLPRASSAPQQNSQITSPQVTLFIFIQPHGFYTPRPNHHLCIFVSDPWSYTTLLQAMSSGYITATQRRVVAQSA